MIGELILSPPKEGDQFCQCFVADSYYHSQSYNIPYTFNRLCCFHRLFQVEYAIEAVKLGSTAVGIQTTEGIILAVEKRLTSTLLEPSSVEKIMEVDFHIGAAVSGLIGGTATISFF